MLSYSVMFVNGELMILDYAFHVNGSYDSLHIIGGGTGGHGPPNFQLTGALLI